MVQRQFSNTLKNEEIKIQLEIIAGLTCRIRELCLIKITTRRDMSDNIVAPKSRLERLKNDILNIIQLIQSICVDDEHGTRTRLLS